MKKLLLMTNLLSAASLTPVIGCDDGGTDGDADGDGDGDGDGDADADGDAASGTPTPPRLPSGSARRPKTPRAATSSPG